MGMMKAGKRLPKWARVAVTIVAAWDLAWKGVALWQAVKRRQPAWFAALLVLNTVGVLPITYLWLMRRRDAAAALESDPWTAPEWDAPADA